MINTSKTAESIEGLSTESAYKYWAFLSYSHRDTEAVKELHSFLETYKVPKQIQNSKSRFGKIPPRLYPIFRDREELPTVSRLDTAIEQALEDSRCLVVVCSPAAAQSQWVNEEIRYFKSLGRADRVLAYILDGIPNASKSSNPEFECFPPALRYELSNSGVLSNKEVEPVAADSRPEGDGKLARLKVVAGLLGVGFGELRNRDSRRRRQMQAILALLVSIGVALYSFHRSNLINIESKRLEARKNLAVEQYAAAKQEIGKRNFDQARSLLKEASTVNWNKSGMVGKTLGWVEQISSAKISQIDIQPEEFPEIKLRVSPDNSRILLHSEYKEELYLVNLETKEKIFKLKNAPAFDVDWNRQQIVVGNYDGHVKIYNSVTGRLLGDRATELYGTKELIWDILSDSIFLLDQKGDSLRIKYSAALLELGKKEKLLPEVLSEWNPVSYTLNVKKVSNYLLLSQSFFENSPLYVYDTKNSKLLWNKIVSSPVSEINSQIINRKFYLLLRGESHGKLTALELETGQAIELPSGTDSLTASSQGELFGVSYRDGSGVQLWRGEFSENRVQVLASKSISQLPISIAASADRNIFLQYHDSVQRYSAETLEIDYNYRICDGKNSRHFPFAVSDDGKYLFTAHKNKGTIEVWDARHSRPDRKPVTEVTVKSDNPFFSSSQDGNKVLVGDADSVSVYSENRGSFALDFSYLSKDRITLAAIDPNSRCALVGRRQSVACFPLDMNKSFEKRGSPPKVERLASKWVQDEVSGSNISFSGDGKFLSIADLSGISTNGKSNNKASVIEIESGSLIFNISSSDLPKRGTRIVGQQLLDEVLMLIVRGEDEEAEILFYPIASAGENYTKFPLGTHAKEPKIISVLGDSSAALVVNGDQLYLFAADGTLISKNTSALEFEPDLAVVDRTKNRASLFQEIGKRQTWKLDTGTLEPSTSEQTLDPWREQVFNQYPSPAVKFEGCQQASSGITLFTYIDFIYDLENLDVVTTVGASLNKLERIDSRDGFASYLFTPGCRHTVIAKTTKRIWDEKINSETPGQTVFSFYNFLE